MSFTLSSISSSIWVWYCFWKTFRQETRFKRTPTLRCLLRWVCVRWWQATKPKPIDPACYLLAHLHGAQLGRLVLGVHHHVEHGAYWRRDAEVCGPAALCELGFKRHPSTARWFTAEIQNKVSGAVAMCYSRLKCLETLTVIRHLALISFAVISFSFFQSSKKHIRPISK